MKILLAIILSIILCPCTNAQKIITLEEAVEHVVQHTRRARSIRLSYENSTLRFHNFQKDFLPSISFKIAPFSFNRSFERLQNASDGSYSYVEDYNGSSSCGMFLRQKISATGGYIEMGTSLYYLREFNSNRNSFNSRPLYISLSQPLWGGRKSFRLNKAVEFLNFSVATKRLIKSLADCQKETATLYLQAYIARNNVAYSKLMSSASDTILKHAKLELQYGRIAPHEYKQVELQWAEHAYQASLAKSTYEQSMHLLANYLESDNNFLLADITIKNHPFIDVDIAYQHALSNNPQLLENELLLATARKRLYDAKNETRASSSISLNYGINQYAHSISMAYRHPSQQQNAQITLSLPIFNWGMNRNKRRMAENDFQQELINQEQSRNDFKLYIYRLSHDCNNAAKHLELALQAYQTAEETYIAMTRQYALARITIADLQETRNTLIEYKKTFDEALKNYVNDYYELRVLTLYDFKKHTDINFIIY